MQKIINIILLIFIMLLLSSCTPAHQIQIYTSNNPSYSTDTRYKVIDTLSKKELKSEAIIKLDTFGHTSIIDDIIVTKDKDIITSSHDKTIRVWSKDGIEKRKILGEVGSFNKGMIYAIALSSNEKYLAVGGYIEYKNDSSFGSIRIYNYTTGKLIKVLKSHTNVVLDLEFSKDDSYLISGSADTSVKIWKVDDNFKLNDTFIFHTKAVNDVEIIKKDSKYFLISAGEDNQLAMYDIQNRRIVKSELDHSIGRYDKTRYSLVRVTPPNRKKTSNKKTS